MGAFWGNVPTVIKTIQTKFGDGINAGMPSFSIKDSELTNAVNVKTDDYPAITTRDARTSYSSGLGTTDINAFGQRNNTQLHVATSNTWKYWSSTSWVDITTTLSNSPGKFIDFAVGTNLYTLYFNSTQMYGWSGTSTRFVLTNAPATDKVATHKGRIYAVGSKVLYYSALNKSTDWTTADDAGNITVTNSKGDLTAIKEYADHIITWSEYSMHELYGTGPTNYTLVDISNNIGCVSDRSVQEVKGRLFWLDYEGVYQYTGGEPKKISQKVDSFIKNINWTYKTKISAGTYGDKYYLSIPYSSSATDNNLILVYDVYRDVWVTETGAFDSFVTVGNNLYGMDTTGGIYNMVNGDPTSDVSWSFETKPFYMGDKITVQQMHNVYKGSTSADMTLSYTTSASSTTYNSLISSSKFTMNNSEQRTQFRLPTTDISKEDWYKLKVSGHGKVTYYALEETKRIRRG